MLEAAGWLARAPWRWGEGSVVWLTGAGVEGAGLGGVRAVKGAAGTDDDRARRPGRMVSSAS